MPPRMPPPPPPPSPPDAAILKRMIWRSTGPPGTKCMMTNTASVIPRNVGITNRKRLKKYPRTLLPVALPVMIFHGRHVQLQRLVFHAALDLSRFLRINPPELRNPRSE